MYMKIKCEKFLETASTAKAGEEWNKLVESALDFAAQVDKEKLINISHSVDVNGTKNVFVWFRHDEKPYLEGDWRDK